MMGLWIIGSLMATVALIMIVTGFVVIRNADRERARHYKEYVERNRRDRTFEDKGNGS